MSEYVWLHSGFITHIHITCHSLDNYRGPLTFREAANQSATQTVLTSPYTLCLCENRPWLVSNSVQPTVTHLHQSTVAGFRTPSVLWLLSTDRAELTPFVGPDVVPGGYAILSHVWGRAEQTFEDLSAIAQQCAEIGANPRDYVCRKIRESCLLAEQDGHKWVWIDTCCINKKNSVELSFAIKSMFRYYAMSNACYAYLHDVPTDGIIRDNAKAFRNSRWHRRGWTLQELIAPSFVEFVSTDWIPLGSKHAHAELMEEVTRIPASVLRLEVSLEHISVAQRMSWAADRQTTYVEDMAYCLLGIFDVSIPTLYGEGIEAFVRLQKEIMNTVDDTSLLAWGTVVPANEIGLQRSYEGFPQELPYDNDGKALAYSPHRFLSSSTFMYSPRSRPVSTISSFFLVMPYNLQTSGQT